METRFLLDGTFSFITGAAPSKTDIISMLPGLIIIVAAIYALSYFGIKILYLYIIFSWLSAALTVAIIPLLGVTVIVIMLKLIAVVKSP